VRGFSARKRLDRDGAVDRADFESFDSQTAVDRRICRNANYHLFSKITDYQKSVV